MNGVHLRRVFRDGNGSGVDRVAAVLRVGDCLILTLFERFGNLGVV